MNLFKYTVSEEIQSSTIENFNELFSYIALVRIKKKILQET
jgi:hypothetical protein